MSTSEVRAAVVSLGGAVACHGGGMTELDTAATLYILLGRLIRVLRQESDSGPVGPGGVSAMVTLSRAEGGLRLGELADAEGVSKPSMTRIVNGLEELGMVRRSPDPADGRALRVELSEAGAAAITSGQHSRMQALRLRFEALDPADRDRLEAAMPAIEALVARRSA